MIYDQAKILGSYLKDILSGIISSLQNNNGAINATATVALAVITYAYLKEVEQQRIFSYEQLALQNIPELLIVPEQSFELGDPIRISIAFKNNGGTLNHLNANIVILCCVSFDNLPKVSIR